MQRTHNTRLHAHTLARCPPVVQPTTAPPPSTSPSLLRAHPCARTRHTHTAHAHGRCIAYSRSGLGLSQALPRSSPWPLPLAALAALWAGGGGGGGSAGPNDFPTHPEQLHDAPRDSAAISADLVQLLGEPTLGVCADTALRHGVSTSLNDFVPRTQSVCARRQWARFHVAFCSVVTHPIFLCSVCARPGALGVSDADPVLLVGSGVGALHARVAAQRLTEQRASVGGPAVAGLVLVEVSDRQHKKKRPKKFYYLS